MTIMILMKDYFKPGSSLSGPILAEFSASSDANHRERFHISFATGIFFFYFVDGVKEPVAWKEKNFIRLTGKSMDHH